MLGFVHSWFAPTANPVGIDFGSDSLRLAQVETIEGEAGAHRVVAAARADVPALLRNDWPGRLAFFAETVRSLWSAGNFRGRRVVLGLPGAAMTIQHLRVAKMDDAALKMALPWEARGKLPYDPTHAVLRHMVAGEVHQDGEQKSEVILMAAQRELVNALLGAAGKARLDVVGMNVEPKAIVDCFAHVYRRRSDAEATSLFVDIGCASARAFVSRGGQILFARSIPIGGEHFTRAVAVGGGCGFDEARLMRMQDCRGGDAGTEAVEALAKAVAEPVSRLAEELDLCRRYYEATFPAQPVNRMVFVGGEAHHRGLCQAIARKMELAAQIGDPMMRMARVSDIAPQTGLDRRLPQPDWAVAIGLSMGPLGAAVPVEQGVQS